MLILKQYLNKFLSTYLLFTQFIKFAFVGVVNTTLDLAVLNTIFFLIPSSKSGVLYTCSRILSGFAGMVNSYVLNRYLTFNSKNKISADQIGKFLIITVIGVLLNALVSSFILKEVAPPDFLINYWPTVAAILGIPVNLVWNFLGYRFFVFS